jgi:iron complex outermembrane receptor protein
MYRGQLRVLARAASVGGTLYFAGGALAQDASETVPLPPVVVEQTAAPAPAKKAKKKSGAQKSAAQPSPAVAPATTTQATGTVQPGTRSGSLTVPTTAEAIAEIERTPGAVEVVPVEEYAKSTPAVTIKDALDYVPGVWVQPKFGEDSKFSIRGSGLSRNYHTRSVQFYLDGIPISTADGYSNSFAEIDPTAYRYIEVYKGANALRFGANSLGGAVNFVLPTGYNSDAFGTRLDIGSFGFRKLAASSGGVSGPADYFITGTWRESDGFREQNEYESVRGAMNVGYRLNENVETRFYLTAVDARQQIPGQLSKAEALTSPKMAAPINIVQNWQLNVESYRVANKTTVRVSPGTFVEFGAFYYNNKTDHPIAIYIDWDTEDYGGFARVTDQRRIGGYKNRFVAGVNVHNGVIDNQMFENIGDATKGFQFNKSKDRSKNTAVYAENSFYVLDDVALVAGVQYLHATRDTYDRLWGAPPEGTEFDLWSPKVGVLWDVTPWTQVFANISRSGEVPSLSDETGQPPLVSFTDLRAQRATTYEIGTRGQTANYFWDFALYRSVIDNELQCFTVTPGTCDIVNADSTVNQGVELGFGAALARSVFVGGARSDEVWLHTAYTYNDFFFYDDAVWGNNKLPGAPPHYIRAELLYKHPSGVYAGPNLEWVPVASFVDNANTLKSDSYALLGAKIGFDDGGPFAAYVEARNLTDEAYIASHAVRGIASADDRLFEPGTGRAIYAGAQYRW